MPYLVRIAFPSAGHPDPIRGCAIRGSARRDTHKALIDQQRCLQVCTWSLSRVYGPLIHALIVQTLQRVTVARRAIYRCEPNSRHPLALHHA